MLKFEYNKEPNTVTTIEEDGTRHRFNALFDLAGSDNRKEIEILMQHCYARGAMSAREKMRKAIGVNP